MEKEHIEYLKWLLTGIGALIGMFVTYRFGRKTKIDEISLKKAYEMAEKIAELIQEDHHIRELLLENYNKNLGHMTKEDAIEAFHKYRGLYHDMKEQMVQLPRKINELQELNRKAIIFLSKKLTGLIDQYIKMTRISFITDGTGIIINTYAEEFFENLRDEIKLKERRGLYEKILDELRKLKA